VTSYPRRRQVGGRAAGLLPSADPQVRHRDRLAAGGGHERSAAGDVADRAAGHGQLGEPTRRQLPHRDPGVRLSASQRHPLLNSVNIFTLVIGLVSFALGLVIRNVPGASLGTAIATTATGLVAMLVGLCAQMMSATREERVLIVTGIIGGFVGFALGLAHGGFSG
jgi:hypothetical protein